MNILVLASQKGGTGKTTLSGHLAVEAHNAGVGPVALIDTDPQGSLSQWWNARKAPEPLFVKVGPFELAKILEDLTRSGIKLAVIDTPPAITESISYVIGHADLVILPTRPGPHDLRAVGPTVDIAGRYDKPLLFVVNAATPRAHHGRSGRGAVAARNRGTHHHPSSRRFRRLDGGWTQRGRSSGRVRIRQGNPGTVDLCARSLGAAEK